MRRRIECGTPTAILTATAILAGCSSFEADAETSPAPDWVRSDIGAAALTGVWVVPYEVPIEGGRKAERSFALIDDGDSTIACDDVGEQRQASIQALYATDEQGELQQFSPPDKVVSAFSPDTVQCVQFDPADGDIINKDGIPEVGIFDGGERRFVIAPVE